MGLRWTRVLANNVVCRHYGLTVTSPVTNWGEWLVTLKLGSFWLSCSVFAVTSQVHPSNTHGTSHTRGMIVHLRTVARRLALPGHTRGCAMRTARSAHAFGRRRHPDHAQAPRAAACRRLASIPSPSPACTVADVEAYRADGFVVMKDVLTEEEKGALCRYVTEIQAWQVMWTAAPASSARPRLLLG